MGAAHCVFNAWRQAAGGGYPCCVSVISAEPVTVFVGCWLPALTADIEPGCELAQDKYPVRFTLSV